MYLLHSYPLITDLVTLHNSATSGIDNPNSNLDFLNLSPKVLSVSFSSINSLQSTLTDLPSNSVLSILIPLSSKVALCKIELPKCRELLELQTYLHF